jgi:hypothetical protein
LRELRGHRIRHRTQRNRREVTVPYRVLMDSEVVGASGFPLPARLCRSQATGPPGVSSSVLAQGRDSLNVPLLRFDPPTRFSLSPPSGFRPEGNSHGVPSPTALQVARVHVPSRMKEPPKRRYFRVRLPGRYPGICRRFPHRRLRSRSQVFPTSQRPSSSRHRPTIFRWMALMGFALQRFVPSAKPRRLVTVGMPS